MISKFQINKDILNCSKCEQFNHNLLSLPCHHFVCVNCINSQKVKIFYHCKKWKLFFNNEINSSVSTRKSKKNYEKFIRFHCDVKLNILELFLSSYYCNDTNFELFKEIFKCQNCFHLSSKICIDYFGNFNCDKCFQYAQVIWNENLNLEYKQTLTSILNHLIEILNVKVEKLFCDMETFFNEIDSKLAQAVCFISNENFIKNFYLDEKKVILNANNSINICRDRLIQELKSKKLASLKYSSNNFKQLSFKTSETSLLSIQIIGYFKNVIPMVQRVKFVHFYPKLFSFRHSINLEENVINWTPFNKIMDFFSPIYSTRFYWIFLKSIEKEFNYEALVHDSITNHSFIQHKFANEFKIDYFRIDYTKNRIGLLFEINYDSKYVLKIYDLYGPKLLCSKTFNFYIDNFLFDGKLILTWSSNRPICLDAYDENLQNLEEKIKIDECIYDLFYYLADCDEEFMFLNNQYQIGKVCKKTGKLVRIFNLNESTFIIAEGIQRPLHVPSEYLNVKIYQEFMIVTTYSKIFIVDKKNFKLLSDNKIFLIKNNNWLIPNKIYLTKDGYLAFFDENNITFI